LYVLEQKYRRAVPHPGITREDVFRQEEIGFCSMWALDNVFPCSGRVYAHQRADVSSVNVMLDVKDATRFLKLGPTGLEARNDACTFESVRATCCASASGIWYYHYYKCQCMYVCMYVRMIVCMYVCMYICMYVCECVCMHAISIPCRYYEMVLVTNGVLQVGWATKKCRYWTDDGQGIG
jgi:hypothetical protein